MSSVPIVVMEPQQATLSSVLTPQVWKWPALTDLNVARAGALLTTP